MRVAVVERKRCQPKKCSLECIKFCPVNRTGGECIVLSEEHGKAQISEELCTGCGICVKKCPFTAITIVGLPEELREDITHRYGENLFRLFRLPYPRKNSVLGLIGQNGTGKTTIVRILSGEIIPNLGDWRNGDKSKVLKHFSGTQFYEYFEKLYNGDIRAVAKPQYVDQLPRVIQGKVKDILKDVDEKGELGRVLRVLELDEAKNRDIMDISGGELQRVAIAAALLKEGDIYIFDEPSSYLDVRQRLKVAETIRRLSRDKRVLVVEHDLIVLDYLADYVNIVYGVVGAYGIVSHPMTAKQGINVYLGGYLKEENIRFRSQAVKFEVKAPPEEWKGATLLCYPDLSKSYEGFKLHIEGGEINTGEVVGILGPNATGKTTFVKMLAGVVSPDAGKIKSNIKVSYKPQYIKPENEISVAEVVRKVGESDPAFFEAEVARPLDLKPLMDRKLRELSGGELQRIAIAACLGREADIYLLDEPSAYLDVEQRLRVAKVIRRVMEKKEVTGIVVDHDLLFIDYISDRLIVFDGNPGVEGRASKPQGMKEGMNSFLQGVGITFRRDPHTGRPRANKPDSRKDKEQKAKGEYYYLL